MGGVVQGSPEESDHVCSRLFRGGDERGSPREGTQLWPSVGVLGGGSDQSGAGHLVPEAPRQKLNMI